jgi:recombination protein RecR
MKAIPDSLERLVQALSKLPGVGRKTALRHALHLARFKDSLGEDLAGALEDLRRNLRLCGQCHAISEGELCPVCQDPGRDPKVLCVVEGYPELLAFEETGVFRGRYHVLHGLLSPVRGIGPGQLNLDGLLARCKAQGVQEVVVATSLTSDGETTALYIRKVFEGSGIQVSRPASGMPFGAAIEFMDGETLAKAMDNRRNMG